MKIGVISDTHNKPVGIDGAFAMFDAEKVSLVVHCGDWTKLDTVKYFANVATRYRLPVKGVLGNNDLEVEQFLGIAGQLSDFDLTDGVLYMEIDEQKVAAYHGHHKPTLRRLMSENLDLVLLGHSHKPHLAQIDHKMILNPGSTAFAIPRSKTWRASVAIYDTETREAHFQYFD